MKYYILLQLNFSNPKSTKVEYALEATSNLEAMDSIKTLKANDDAYVKKSNGDFMAGSCTHTSDSGEFEPWWTVSFGRHVKTIKIEFLRNSISNSFFRPQDSS